MNASETRRFIQKIIASNGDVYRVLGLDAGSADEATLKKAYRRLALKVHPDKCQNENLKSDCSVAFQILTKSYERALIELSPNTSRKKQRRQNDEEKTWYQENTPMTDAWTEPPPQTVPVWSPPLQGISTRPMKTTFSAREYARRPFHSRPFTSGGVPPIGSMSRDPPGKSWVPW